MWHNSKYSRCFGYYFLQNTLGLGVLASTIDTDLNYEIAMLFILTGTNKSYNHIIRKKAYLLFSKFKTGNWEWSWSQITFSNTETSTNQF